MQKQWVILGVVLALVLLVYGWVFFGPGPALEIETMVTPKGPIFTLNGRVEFYEVKVTQPGVTDEDGEPTLLWHLVPRDVEGVDPPEVMVVSYGEPRGLGLRPAKGTRGRGRALEAGGSYVFWADTSGGEIEQPFTMP